MAIEVTDGVMKIAGHEVETVRELTAFSAGYELGAKETRAILEKQARSLGNHRTDDVREALRELGLYAPRADPGGA